MRILKYLLVLLIMGLLVVGDCFAAKVKIEQNPDGTLTWDLEFHEGQTKVAAPAPPRFVKIKTYPYVGFFFPAFVAAGFCYYYTDNWLDHDKSLGAMKSRGISISSEEYKNVEGKRQKTRTGAFISGSISLFCVLIAPASKEKEVAISENMSLEWDVGHRELRLAYRW